MLNGQNKVLVSNSTSSVGGMSFYCRERSLLNRFCTGVDRCNTTGNLNGDSLPTNRVIVNLMFKLRKKTNYSCPMRSFREDIVSQS